MNENVALRLRIMKNLEEKWNEHNETSISRNDLALTFLSWSPWLRCHFRTQEYQDRGEKMKELTVFEENLWQMQKWKKLGHQCEELCHELSLLASMSLLKPRDLRSWSKTKKDLLEIAWKDTESWRSWRNLEWHWKRRKGKEVYYLIPLFGGMREVFIPLPSVHEF